ncbi:MULTISPECIES: cryptochrome/photolyase family protein [Legionella]|uniref:cryptochrome/photolyase family protein n=1 Tax=Legionella TaxID=445 RepID=UPI000F8F3E65|nr:deoxyribodipyrimidine photo-lyase [Legionella septentrionalis]MCP0914689.1 DNA photolyase family protein [Legionella sp. 27cVA30]RUR09156.1 deoxyribodipyrimidine photo-lyase [Legionella septentrionalis]
MMTALFWFRQDLRCDDNAALAAACNRHNLLIPLYIDSDNPQRLCGAAQKWWLHHSLLALNNYLCTQNTRLCLKQGNPLDVLMQLIKQHQVTHIYWNECIEPELRKEEQQIKSILQQNGIQIETYPPNLFFTPAKIHTQQQTIFKRFTPFWRYCLQHLAPPPPAVIKKWPACPAFSSEQLDDWHLLPAKPDWASNFKDYWQPGEQGAQEKLQQFIEDELAAYDKNRDLPARQATSRLSPHLHFGEISPWRIWQELEKIKFDSAYSHSAIEKFLAELGWREFSYYTLYHYPALPHSNIQKTFDEFKWKTNKVYLQAWHKGQTGFPIVDAGMRELWQTGYMHNRVRMITASFLTKNLLIDWRTGAAWFEDTLLDADLAANSFNWQWVAGSGMDAAPYFRIFNPVLQGEKFDSSGEYVKKWVPELTSLPVKWLHKPWQMHAQPGFILGKNYPFPIIDLTQTRIRALAAYRELKK